MADEIEPTRIIGEFDNPADAAAVQHALDGAGIEAVLLTRLRKPVQIGVPDSQMEAALTVLAKLDGQPDAGWESAAEKAIEGWLCLNCDTVVSSDESACPECGTLRSAQTEEDGAE